MTRPFLLLTNDDGIHAPGIKHLWQAVHEYADVAIVAPLIEKSGCGLSITWGKPLKVHPVNWENNTSAWSLTGTPADCVKMALAVLLKRKPDLVISGINRGSNSGRTALYSGTIGGVIEGAMKGIQGIAFSFSDYETTPSVNVTKQYILALIDHFINDPLPPETILNVNFPYHCEKKIKGIRLAKQGKGHWVEDPDRRIHPEGLPYYWLGGRWRSFEEEPDSDVTLLEQGYITAVPLQIGQLTHFEVFLTHKERIQEKLNTIS
ncbi:MAG TPA: 5'/3'-nucleotidase SurE [Chlamydiales bacterium]|nr:5'/3'-nucleotidase SurE [Chlamydiales bacterium]